MAAPATTSDTYRGTRTRVVVISQSGANNGNVDLELNRPMTGLSVQLAGTYVAGTLALQACNDNENFAALPTAVSFTGTGIKAAAIADLAFRYYRLAFSSMDSGNTLTTTLVAKFAN